MIQDRINEITENGTPTTVGRELIPNSGGQHRITRQLYFEFDGVVEKVIKYKYGVDSPSWLQIASIILREPPVQEITTFRSIPISKHPDFPEVTRTVNLADTAIRKDEIIVTVIVKHSNEIPDVILPLVADNTTRIDGTSVGLSNDVGERDYWEYLTDSLKMDVYTLFDGRIPVLDANGRFNIIY